MFDIIQGDCLVKLREMADNSVDSIVTDPPYGLSFMGKKWDYDVPGTDIWKEALRVLKPGGYLLAFAGTRTQHRMAVNIEDAGFEIRDMIAWVYGSGFPKSLDISKAIDKGEGHWRGKAGKLVSENGAMSGGNYERTEKGDPVTTAAKWQGWGTALKPALEPITVARKPFNSTVAENVLQHGTGGINIDGCRVGLEGEEPPTGSAKRVFKNNGFNDEAEYGDNTETPLLGRFPANFIHDGSEDVIELFPNTKSGLMKAGTPRGRRNVYGDLSGESNADTYADAGNAARFFYCAKASKSERDAGLEHLELKPLAFSNQAQAELKRGSLHEGASGINTAKLRSNNHPTVKPMALMRYLCRLVTPPGGLVLDPFCGSGTTGCAAVLEDFYFTGIEREADYVSIAEARILHHLGDKLLQ